MRYMIWALSATAPRLMLIVGLMAVQSCKTQPHPAASPDTENSIPCRHAQQR